LKLLSERCEVRLVDEFRTTKNCPACHTADHFRHMHAFRYTSNKERVSQRPVDIDRIAHHARRGHNADNTCHLTLVDRDCGAAKNIAYGGMHELLHGTRPPPFRREPHGHHTGTAETT
jgi:hypothetical protein